MKTNKVAKAIKKTIQTLIKIVLMNLPLWMYLLILKNTKNRFQKFSGMVGTNPKCILVSDDVILINLDSMQI